MFVVDLATLQVNADAVKWATLAVALHNVESVLVIENTVKRAEDSADEVRSCDVENDYQSKQDRDFNASNCQSQQNEDG